MTRLTRLLAIALLSATPTIALAQPLRYLGRAPDATGGAIALGERAHGDIYPGTNIPGWGRVKEVRDERIVIERSRTGAEKEEMARRGALSHDVLEIHVLRDDPRDAAASGFGTYGHIVNQGTSWAARIDPSPNRPNYPNPAFCGSTTTSSRWTSATCR